MGSSGWPAVNLWQTFDRRHTAALRDLGWNVIIVWECETRDPQLPARLDRALRRVVTYEVLEEAETLRAAEEPPE